MADFQVNVANLPAFQMAIDALVCIAHTVEEPCTYPSAYDCPRCNAGDAIRDINDALGVEGERLIADKDKTP